MNNRSIEKRLRHLEGRVEEVREAYENVGTPSAMDVIYMIMQSAGIKPQNGDSMADALADAVGMTASEMFDIWGNPSEFPQLRERLVGLIPKEGMNEFLERINRRPFVRNFDVESHYDS